MLDFLLAEGVFLHDQKIRKRWDKNVPLGKNPFFPKPIGKKIILWYGC